MFGEGRWLRRGRAGGLFGGKRRLIARKPAHFRGKRLLVVFERRDPTFGVHDRF